MHVLGRAVRYASGLVASTARERAETAAQEAAHGPVPRFTMPKEMTASEEYTRAQEQTSLERVFNNLDKKGDGKVCCFGKPL